MRRTGHNSGFSLIEVLVAFSIAAISLAILFQIYAKGVAAATLGEEYTQAIAVAESRLAETGQSEDINDGQRSGREGDKYSWTVITTDYIEEQESEYQTPFELKHVEVEVSWDSRGKTRSIKLNTLKPFLKEKA